MALKPHFDYYRPNYYYTSIISNKSNQMLNYHIIHSQPAQTTTANYNHFLTLGSHKTVINLNPLLSFSLVSLHKGTKLYIDQENMEEGCFNVAVNLGKSIRVNGNVQEKDAVVGKVKVLEDIIEGVQQGQNIGDAEILYILLRGEANDIGRKIQEEAIRLTNNISVSKIQISQQKSLTLNKRILILIRSGKLKMQQTGQQIQAGECIYTRKGCGDVIACQNCQIIQVEFL